MKPALWALIGLVSVGTPVLAEETCVEVEIGGEKAPNLNCLNQHLQKQVDSVRPSETIAPLDASSSAVRLGGTNETALKQQYGPNYGKSAVPWRSTSSYGTLH